MKMILIHPTHFQILNIDLQQVAVFFFK